MSRLPSDAGRGNIGDMNTRLPSNSAAHGFKDYEYPIRKAPGVFRIFVLGDSLAFGQGVKIDEAFSKVLERMLNQQSSSAVYEVINSADPGMNAIQECCLQKTLGVDYAPDLYLVALCHNDAELTQPPDLSDYDDHIRRIWDPEGESFPYFEGSLRLMKETADTHGAKLVVAYCVFCDVSLAPQAPGILEQTCRKLEIPFTNTIETTKQYPAKQLWVNKVETHPNPFGHRLVAQHLLKHLTSEGFLPQEDPEADEGEILRKVLSADLSSESPLRSDSLSFPLARTYSLLQTKRQRRSFGRQEGKGRLTTPEIDAALEKITPLLRRAQFLECLDGYDTYLRTMCVQHQYPLFELRQMLSDLALSLFYLGVTNRIRSVLPDLSLEAEGEPQAPDIESFVGARHGLDQVVEAIDSLERDLGLSYRETLEPYRNAPPAASFLGPGPAEAAERLSIAAANGNRPLGLFLAEARRVGNALRTAGGELLAALEVIAQMREEDFPDVDQYRRYGHFVGGTVNLFLHLAERFRFCTTEIDVGGLAKMVHRMADETTAPWLGRNVEFEVTVVGTPKDDYSHLGLYWSSIVPLRAPQRDGIAIETDGGLHAYRFKFDVGVLGYFVLDFKNSDPDQVRSIRMLLNDKPVGEWSGEGLQRIIDSGLRSELLIFGADE